MRLGDAQGWLGGSPTFIVSGTVFVSVVPIESKCGGAVARSEQTRSK